METISKMSQISVKKCLYCKKTIKKTNKFCSHKCYSKNKIGKKHYWGFKISKALKGKPKTPEHIANVIKAITGKKHLSITGEKHFNWKGENLGYRDLHEYVRKHYPKSKECDFCGSKRKIKISKNGRLFSTLDWANKSGKYLRARSDWFCLCRKCHIAYDKTITNKKFIHKIDYL